MFGKPISQYLAFQKVFLGLVIVVGLIRLGLSLAGLPNATVAWFSMNVVSWAAVAYYGVAVHTKGFGGYRQLLPLGFFQIAAQQVVAALGILLALAGLDNVFGAPEYSFGAKSQWMHLLSHLTIGLIVPTLLFWGAGSLVLAITKRVTARPAHACTRGHQGFELHPQAVGQTAAPRTSKPARPIARAAAQVYRVSASMRGTACRSYRSRRNGSRGAAAAGTASCARVESPDSRNDHTLGGAAFRVCRPRGVAARDPPVPTPSGRGGETQRGEAGSSRAVGARAAVRRAAPAPGRAGLRPKARRRRGPRPAGRRGFAGVPR